MLNRLQKLQKTNRDGFTIIEVMIVLAVAGLILLIVLLAVPALERNSRNTAIKNDASTVAGGISTYTSDNNGTAPTAVGGTGSVILNAGKSTPSETITVQGSTVVALVTKVPTSLTSGNIDVFAGQTCSGTVSPRAFSIYYPIETSGSTNVLCLDT